MRRQPLDDLFSPRTVAVVGASETAASPGRRVLWNLLRSPFGGTVYPVAPGRASVLGVRAHARLSDVPEPLDLAVIVATGADASQTLAECASVGVRMAVLLSPGLRETGACPPTADATTLVTGTRGPVRVLGPSSFGVMRPPGGLNATVATAAARAGSVAFLSQSGAIASAVLDWAARENVGFSALVSVGAMGDVEWSDLVDHLGHDESTRSLLLHMDSVGHARRFISAAREVALAKPIIVMKSRHHGASARAAADQGARVDLDEIVDAAFHRCGVLRVATIAELFYMAEVLAKQPRPRGPRLAIVTNAGGPGALAADALLAYGGALADLGDDSLAALDACLPPGWSGENPVDVLADADPTRYRAAIEIAARDPGTDGVLAILTPQPAADAVATAETLSSTPRPPGIPLLASWMGGEEVAAGEARLSRAGVPTFPFPDTAARLFAFMWHYSRNLRALYETPTLGPGLASDEAQGAATAALLERYRQERRIWLTEPESMALLESHGVPVAEIRLAATEHDAAEAAAALGFPVVVRASGPPGQRPPGDGAFGVGLRDEAAVRAAFRRIEAAVGHGPGASGFEGVIVQPMVVDEGCEVRLRSMVDAQFGPVIVFGAGGRLGELLDDRAVALPPLTSTLARRLIEQTRIGRALVSRRCETADTTALEHLVARVSHLVAAQRLVREIDVDRVLVGASRLLVLDARVALHEPEVDLDRIAPPAIRPYPSRYVGGFTLKDGSAVVVRPIRPEDEPHMVRFHESLSDRSVYFRFFHTIKLGERVSHDRLIRTCFIDYDRDIALVAEGQGPDGPQVTGVGRLTKVRGMPVGEFAIVVRDEAQGLGLGTELLRRLVAVGRAEGLERITGEILPENREMQVVAERVGFTCRFDRDTGTVHADLHL
ncbi:MAG: GNAT family N-acetyltransferase [Acidobacteria bacterium]|nr:GNAT family N-acetyltransferase [Acidobacteriota bacterium]